MCVGLPDFSSRNPRERFLFMHHICQISDIPQLLQICCECTNQLCSCHARDGRLSAAGQAGVLVRSTGIRCIPVAWNATDFLTYPVNLLAHHQPSARGCLISRNARKIARVLSLLGHKLQEGKEGMLVKK